MTRKRDSGGGGFGLLFQLLVLWPAAFAMAWALGSVLLKETPYSAFYAFPHARLEREHADRRGRALRFFEAGHLDAEARAAPLLDGTPRRDPRYVDTCVAVLRDERGYFLPTMHSLLGAMRSNERDSVHIVVVDTTARSMSNGTARDLDLVRPFVDSIVAPPAVLRVLRAGGNQNGLRGLRHVWERRELHDYAMALRYCARTMRKKYSMTMVLEDDILMADGFLAHFHALCKKHRCRIGQPLGSVKLFTTEYYWGWEIDEANRLVLAGLGGAALSACALLCGAALCRDRRLAKRKSSKSSTPARVSLLAVFARTRWWHLRRGAKRLGGWQAVLLHAGMAGVFFVCALLAIGRQTLFPPYVGRDGIWKFPDKTIDSNTVATVFDTRRAGDLATVMEIAARRHGDVAFETAFETDPAPFRPVDLLIDNWCKSKKLKRMYVVPALVQHVGLWSSSKSKSRMQHRLHRDELENSVSGALGGAAGGAGAVRGQLRKSPTKRHHRWGGPWHFKWSMSFEASVRERDDS